MDVKHDDRLGEIFRLQAELDARIRTQRNLDMTLDETVLGVTIAMESEIDEIRREINWKWWKNPKPVDMPRLQSEVIDLWHFLVSLSQTVGLMPQDVLDAYKAKNAENHARQDGAVGDGYKVEDDAVERLKAKSAVETHIFTQAMLDEPCECAVCSLNANG